MYGICSTAAWNNSFQVTERSVAKMGKKYKPSEPQLLSMLHHLSSGVISSKGLFHLSPVYCLVLIPNFCLVFQDLRTPNFCWEQRARPGSTHGKRVLPHNSENWKKAAWPQRKCFIERCRHLRLSLGPSTSAALNENEIVNDSNQ